MTRQLRETEAGQKHHCDTVKYTQKTLSGFSWLFFFLYFNHCIPTPFPTDKKRNRSLDGFEIVIWMKQVYMKKHTHDRYSVGVDAWSNTNIWIWVSWSLSTQKSTCQRCIKSPEWRGNPGPLFLRINPQELVFVLNYKSLTWEIPPSLAPSGVSNHEVVWVHHASDLITWAHLPYISLPSTEQSLQGSNSALEWGSHLLAIHM